MRIEQQITKCRKENKACAMMESPAEGQQRVELLQVYQRTSGSEERCEAESVAGVKAGVLKDWIVEGNKYSDNWLPTKLWLCVQQ